MSQTFSSLFSLFTQFPISSLLMSCFSPTRLTPSSLLIHFFSASALHPRSTGFLLSSPCPATSLYTSTYFSASGSSWMTSLPSFNNPRIIRLPWWLRWQRVPVMQEIRVRSLGWKDPLKRGMATHFHIRAWKIPGISWMEEPGELESMRSTTLRL